MAGKYNPQTIEKKWQAYWQDNQTFAARDNSSKPKKYVLVEFPYPSGAGLHMGHLRPYVAADIYSRYFRHKGFEVMFPIGWDAFGLPAENYAIKNGVHPSVSTAQNIKNAKAQLHSWGMSFDWNREINTTDPNYYKWTQWIFLQFFKAGLAYEATGLINWCPNDKTGLANEEVVDGRCERCGAVVEKRELRQWYLKITEYADKLLEGLKTLDKWPEAVKIQQENWIGKSTGAEIEFKLSGFDIGIDIFTTRPDTIFGATYLVVAPEHQAIQFLKDSIENWKEVSRYIEQAKGKQEIERTAEGKEKTGVEIKGVRAINPATNEEVPVWVADYVLGSYGTGAIMAVPAHDQRDFDFAKKFKLPIKQVVAEETGISKPGEERRDGGCGIIFDPKSQKYAVAKSADGLIRLFAGGVEDGEDLQQGILREITEESGLHNFEHVEKIHTCFAHFYNSRKQIHRSGLATCYLAVLENTDQLERQLGDHEKDLNLAWVDANEIAENWKTHNQDRSLDHWFIFLRQAVGRAIELGYDAKSDSQIYFQSANTEYGVLVDSSEFTGQKSEDAIPKMAEKYGNLTANYKLRDWVFSRQRYWGEPIPLIHCEKCGVVAVPENELPVKLPDVEKYEPTGTGESPLAAIDSWVNVKCPQCGGPGRRETNTMPQWAGSSWYWLRYTDPNNDKEFASKDEQRYWTPVDVYFGGMEHTTLHLLYSRFWNLFLYDQGLVTAQEPFVMRKPHGIVLGPDGEKMSKSRGNVVNPDDVVGKFGADTLRMYEMFLGPHETMVAWNDQGILGVRRFLERVWTWAEEILEAPHDRTEHPPDSEKVQVALNRLIKKITEDIENFRFNTAISSFMEFHNEIKQEFITLESFKKFLIVLSPFAPHLAEELYHELGGEKPLEQEAWPEFDASKIADKEVEIVIQLNGKVRAKISMPAGSSEEEVKQQAMNIEIVKKMVEGETVKRAVFVKDRLLNLVI